MTPQPPPLPPQPPWGPQPPPLVPGPVLTPPASTSGCSGHGSSHAKWWILGGLGALLLLVLMAAAAQWNLQSPFSIRPYAGTVAGNAEGYDEVRQLAENSEAVREAIGDPMQVRSSSMSSMVSTGFSRGSRHSSIHIELEGPKGKAEVTAKMSRAQGDATWTYEVCEARLPDGKVVQLK